MQNSLECNKYFFFAERKTEKTIAGKNSVLFGNTKAFEKLYEIMRKRSETNGKKRF